jgi:hypothetical protein
MRFEEVVEELHIELIVLDDQNRFGHSDLPSPEGPYALPTAKPLPDKVSLNHSPLPKLEVNSKNFSKSSRFRLTKPAERAKELALDALLFLTEDEERLENFLRETGFAPSDLRRAMGESGFAGVMLDYLCSDESLLIAFAAAKGIDPQEPEAARQFLASGGD